VDGEAASGSPVREGSEAPPPGTFPATTAKPRSEWSGVPLRNRYGFLKPFPFPRGHPHRRRFATTIILTSQFATEL
jgi:hypothetical protein